MFKALAACPDAVVIKPNMRKYAEAGRQIRDLMSSLSPLVEPLSIDEAFLDLQGTDRVHGMAPAQSLAKLQDDVKREVGVTVSVGLSYNKFLAKIASDLDKPDGFSIIGRNEAASFLARQSVRLIWGVGPAMADRLARDGFASIGDLQRADRADLARRYGDIGLRLASLSRGEDARAVRPQRETKTVSSETTFHSDIRDLARLEDRLWDLCETLSRRMKDKQLSGRSVTLKLKSGDFRLITRRAGLDRPSNLARSAFAATLPLLRQAAPGRAWRLVGVAFGDLSPADASPQGEMFATSDGRAAAQEAAIDDIRRRFGENAIAAGRSLRRDED
jgi:DNA polymerase-4